MCAGTCRNSAWAKRPLALAENRNHGGGRDRGARGWCRLPPRAASADGDPSLPRYRRSADRVRRPPPGGSAGGSTRARHGGSIPPTRRSRCSRSKLLGNPDGVYRRGDVVTLLYGTPERVRILVTEIAGSDFTPEPRQEAGGDGHARRVCPIRAARLVPACGSRARPHVVGLLPGGPPTGGSRTR